jgi:DNA-directed RNA polymerase subunit RPC12/RpoP
MRRYNKADVVLTEKVYDRLRPWISAHPHMGLWSGEEHVCGNCGSDRLQRRGFKATAISTYQQYQCQACGAWSRGKTAIARVDERGTA